MTNEDQTRGHDEGFADLERRLSETERALRETREELDRTRSARDALIQQSLGIGARPDRAIDAGRRSASRLLLLLLFCLLLLGVTAVVTYRLKVTSEQLGGRSGAATERRRGRASGVQRRDRVATGRTVVERHRLAVIPVPQLQWVHRAALAPDGRRVAVGGSGGRSVLIDIAGGDSIVGRLEGHRELVRDLVYLADGRLASGGAEGTVRLWSAGGEPAGVVRSSGPPVRALASAGGWLAVASDDPVVELYQLAGGGKVATRRLLEGHEGWVRSVAFSRDGRLLASAGEDGRVRLWRVPAATAAGTLEGHEQWVNALAVSPDGKLLASAGFDKRVYLWDLATRERVAKLWGHLRRVRALAFDAGGKLLASASLDRRIVLWDVGQRRALRLLEGHRRQVTAVAFDPRGRFLLSASGDGTLRLWPLPVPATPSTSQLPPPRPGELTLRGNTSGERMRIRLLGDGGEVLEEGRRQLARILRSGPDDQQAPADRELIKLLHKVVAHFGLHREVLVISGYRSPRFNRLRTRQSRQVGEKSLHMNGKAIDFRIEGVPITTLQKYVKGLRAGGVGYYPDSNFIHMDTGPVRYWSGN